MDRPLGETGKATVTAMTDEGIVVVTDRDMIGTGKSDRDTDGGGQMLVSSPLD